MKKVFLTKIREKVISSYRAKKIMHNILCSPLFTHNYFYEYFYLKNIRNKTISMENRPLSVQIENTNLCNLSCVFCPHETMQRKRGYMPQKLFESIIEQCIKYDISNIVISGFGEPLLDKDYIKKVKFAKDKGITYVQCVSNGILLSKEIAEKLISVGLDYISLSIDASTADIYGRIHRVPARGLPFDEFSVLMQNIDSLIELRKRYNLKKPVLEVRFKDFELNKKDLASFVKKYSRKVDKINIYMNIFSWPGSTIQNNLPKRHILKFPCIYLWSNLYITCQGKVALCCQDYECRTELGDIQKEDIMQIWKGKRLKEIRNIHLNREFEKNVVCKDCNINTHLISPWW